jgi:hypothetical protein
MVDVSLCRFLQIGKTNEENRNPGSEEERTDQESDSVGR